MKTNYTDKKFHKKNLHGFTLVELIVVITILVILGTIAFTSLTGFSGNARDSDRVTTLKNIESGLDLLYIKSGTYPTPENIIGTGVINSTVLSSVGIIGDSVSRIININKTPVDPLSKTRYVYGTNSNRTQHQIATTLENAIAYNNLLPVVYADSSLQARVNGNYPGYIKYGSGTDTYIANIPSLLFNNTGSTNLFSTGTYFIVNKQQNLPYKMDEKTQTQNKNPNEIIQAITHTLTATLTGVNITGITAETLTGTFTPEVLASFGGDIAKMETAVLGKSSTVAPQALISCTTEPTYTNAIFTTWIPTQVGQSWQSTDENVPCYWTCGSGKTLVWNACVVVLSAPVASVASSITATGITWNWQTSVNATSYQFSTDNTTFTDKGNITSFNETGLVCGTSYIRYVKACSAGECSTATMLASASTNACPRGYATWNPGDKNSGIVLSNGNLTATCPSGANTVRATIGKNSGKWYWEYTQNTTSIEPGIANNSASLDYYLGGTANGWMYYNLGQKYTNYIATAYGASYNSTDVLGVALDMDNGTVSFLKNNIFQGIAYTGLTGAIYPATGSDGGGGVAATANFGASPLAYTPSNGTFWNPKDKTASISLTNNNLTATYSASSLVRSNTGKSAGKWYFEIKSVSGAGIHGIAKSTALTTSYPGIDVNSYGYSFTNGNVFNNGTIIGSAGVPVYVGDVLGVALDLITGTVTFYVNGVAQPSMPTGLSGTWYASGGGSGTQSSTVNFGATPFSYSIPSGYSAWDSTTYNAWIYQ